MNLFEKDAPDPDDEKRQKWEEAVKRSRERAAHADRARQPERRGHQRLRWLHTSDQAREVTIRSPLEWWYSHWDVAERRSRRCCGPGCIPCATGSPVVIRYVLAVEEDSGQVSLLELRERHSALLDSLREAPRGQIGRRIRVFKAHKAKNAPVRIELLDVRDVTPIELSRVVAMLGLPAQRSLQLTE